MAKPVLHIFAISHYCEKARWALDHLGVDCDLKHLPPGLHRKVAAKLGARASSLPFLLVNGDIIQGSGNIIDWADSLSDDPAKRLTPTGDEKGHCREIETRLDDTAGVHIRRYYYSEALVDHPETVKPIFTRDLPFLQGLIVGWKWDMIREIMIQRMDLGPEGFIESLAEVEKILDWLDGLLAGGQRYLVGDRFSRADITAASLLAPLAAPTQHPTYANLQLPPRIAEQVDRWRDRPTIGWIADMYRAHR